MNIVITGAGGVLCSAFSRALAADGHKIALLDLNLEAAEREAEGIRKAGGPLPYRQMCWTKRV